MAWITDNRILTQAEMENNADIIINYYRSRGLDDCTIAGILGNMQAESTLSPTRTEASGGGGYGLVQWTPVTSLQDHCSTLGLSPYTSGDVQLQVILEELTNISVMEWYTSSAFIRPYYNSGATTDMANVTASDFLNNTMGWSADKLAIMFMVGYERPTYDPSGNHYDYRMECALNWFSYMGGIIPPTPTDITVKTKFKWVLYARKLRQKRR